MYGKRHSIIQQPPSPTLFSGPIECQIGEVSLYVVYFLLLSSCREAKGEFDIVANSYRVSSEFSSKLFFVMIDIDDNGADAFQAVSDSVTVSCLLCSVTWVTVDKT